MLTFYNLFINIFSLVQSCIQPSEYFVIYTDLSSGARCLMFGRTLRLLPFFMCTNSEGSGETALMHSRLP